MYMASRDRHGTSTGVSKYQTDVKLQLSCWSMILLSASWKRMGNNQDL